MTQTQTIIPGGADRKICNVQDWGTNTDGSPRAIRKAIFPTNVNGQYELYTSPSSHSGLYSHGELSEIRPASYLNEKFGLHLD